MALAVFGPGYYVSKDALARDAIYAEALGNPKLRSVELVAFDSDRDIGLRREVNVNA